VAFISLDNPNHSAALISDRLMWSIYSNLLPQQQ